MELKVIYLPVTMDVLTVGHVRVIRKLARQAELIVGLLDEKALKGYKECAMSYEDRKEIIESNQWIDEVVRQSSLNPYENLIKYKVTHVASGDGFEPEELEAIKKAGCEPLEVRLEGEKDGRNLFASSRIKKKIKRI